MAVRALRRRNGIFLPVDELAFEVLRDLIGNPDEWNSGNWIKLASLGDHDRRARQALIEAWAGCTRTALLLRTSRDLPACVRDYTAGSGSRREGSGGVVRARQRLAIDLHPEIEDKVRPQYLMGDYELAVFACSGSSRCGYADLSGPLEPDLGVRLMQKAFGEDGPYWETTRDRGEQLGRLNLFAGAIGYLKNPTSHREVVYDDPAEAAEVIMLADLLLRILDRIEAERSEI